MTIRSFEHPFDLLNEQQTKEMCACAARWAPCNCGIDIDLVIDCIERAEKRECVPELVDEARKKLGYPVPGMTEEDKRGIVSKQKEKIAGWREIASSTMDAPLRKRLEVYITNAEEMIARTL